MAEYLLPTPVAPLPESRSRMRKPNGAPGRRWPRLQAQLEMWREVAADAGVLACMGAGASDLGSSAQVADRAVLRLEAARELLAVEAELARASERAKDYSKQLRQAQDRVLTLSEAIGLQLRVEGQVSERALQVLATFVA